MANIFVLLSLFIVFETTFSKDLSYNICHKQSDCGVDHCCAVRKMTHKYGFCMPTKDLGDQCTPSYLYGTSFTCGCKIGLTCALVEKNKQTHHEKHRCVQILPEAEEIHENPASLVTDSKTKLLTAHELSRLLKLLNHKPKLKKV